MMINDDSKSYIKYHSPDLGQFL